MFTYEKVKEDKKLIMALTGLKKEECEKLLPIFEEAWKEQIKEKQEKRNERIREYGGGRKENLELIEDKMLFILYYTKVYPLQEILAFEFSMSQSTANYWVQVLSKVLKRALDKAGYLPERDPKELETAMESELETQYAIDGTERRIQRPKDEDLQKQYYSGKKKPIQLKILSLGLLRLRKSNI